MNSSFGETLALWLEKNNLTRNEVIAKLQLADYVTFKGLDNTTISRWINGKSTPPLYKQMLICWHLNENILEFIKRINVDSVKFSTKKSKALSEFIRLLDYVNPKNVYVKGSIYPRITVDILNFQQHTEVFGNFYRNIRPLQTFTKQLYNLGDAVSYPSIRIMNDEGDMLGHWTSIEPLEKVQQLSSFVSLTEKEKNEGILLHVASFQDSKHFFYLIGLAIFFYLLSSRFKGKKTAYLFVFGYSIYELIRLVFNAEDVKYYPPTERTSRLSVYLVKVNVIKVLANPIIASLIQERLKCLDTCHGDCNLCNIISKKLDWYESTNSP